MITPELNQQALLHAQRGGMHCLDAIIDVGGIAEGELLKYLAKSYRTQFVSTSKLAKASISRELLKLVPQRVAERLKACPILFDRRSQTLSVVAADLTELDIAKQIQLVSRVRDVRVYVARPAAVEALVRKHYQSDPFAFADLTLGDRGSVGPAHAHSPNPTGYYDDAIKDGSGLLDISDAAPSTVAPPSIPSPVRAPEPIKIDLPDVPRADSPPPPQPARRAPISLTLDAPKVEELKESKESLEEENTNLASRDYLETLNVLVALLEQGRGELRGHSSQVARLCRRVGERIGLSENQLHGVLVAAYLHDIGKASSTYHLTALNVAQYEGHRVQAEKTCLTPLKMFEAVRLSDSTKESLAHLYERWDGRGFPDRRKGKDIPLGARIVAIAETYCDLTTHAKNPYRKVLGAQEACETIARYKALFFDPNLVDVLRMVVLGDDLKAKLLADRPTVLVVDRDPEETTVLELRLMEHGFEVVVARTSADALERVGKGGVDAVISEVELTPFDGFELAERVRASGGTNLPVLFLTRRGDSASVKKGFELGAADYVVKPASAEVVAAKTRQVLDRGKPSTRGVSGSLSEMSLPDVVQILSNGRKSGLLRLESDGVSGLIAFEEGAIWDATFGEVQGEDAFYAMLVLLEGSFSLDPSGRPQERKINRSTEALLLEGMRRLDEAQR